jgi:hypothetical protein
MKTNEFFNLDDKITLFRMKALQVGLCDNVNCYMLAFN